MHYSNEKLKVDVFSCDKKCLVKNGYALKTGLIFLMQNICTYCLIWVKYDLHPKIHPSNMRCFINNMKCDQTHIYHVKRSVIEQKHTSAACMRNDNTVHYKP